MPEFVWHVNLTPNLCFCYFNVFYMLEIGSDCSISSRIFFVYVHHIRVLLTGIDIFWTFQKPKLIYNVFSAKLIHLE